MNCPDEVTHLCNRVGDKDRLEVVPLVHPMADTSSDSVDILEHGCVLDAHDVTAYGTVDVVVAEELLAKHLGLAEVKAPYGQIGHPILGYLFGMAGPCDNTYLTWA